MQTITARAIHPKTDLVILLMNAVALFFTDKDVFPVWVTSALLIATAVYFFPFKILFTKQLPHKQISGILIAVSLCVACASLYQKIQNLQGIIILMNFAFILYYVFFIVNKNRSEDNYMLVIIAHSLATLLIRV